MQQGLKSGEVAVDDGLDSRLEPEDRAIDADSIDVFIESRPVRKVYQRASASRASSRSKAPSECRRWT